MVPARFIALVSFIVTCSAQAGPLVREANTSLKLPEDIPSGSFRTVDAFPGLRFPSPVGIVQVPGSPKKLVILQQNGIVRLIPDVQAIAPTAEVFLDLSARTAFRGESGLLGLAFHPRYIENGYFYLFYTTSISGKSVQRLARFQRSDDDPNRASPDSELPMIDQVDEASNHNGGDLHFGPDGYLYLSLGDEGGANDAYNNGRFIDKDFFAGILRIDVDQRAGSLLPNPHPSVHANTYWIPEDNPFVGVTEHLGRTMQADNVRTEFWATGLRNPWRFSFDIPTGKLLCGDVGQNTREEIDIIERGGHYGWSYREGTRRFTIGPGKAVEPAGYAPIEPIWDYGRSEGTSVTGGIVYRGNRFSELYGTYVFGDYGSGRVWALRWLADGSVETKLITTVAAVTAFGTDPSTGDLLLAAYNTGQIGRLARSGLPVDLRLPQTLSNTGAFTDLTTLTPNQGIVAYEPNVSFWSDAASKKRWFTIPEPDAKITYADSAPWRFPKGTVWIKHFDLLGRRLETRFLVKTETSVYGLSYRWNEAQDDAELVPEEGADALIGEQQQPWRFPSRNECLACHTSAAGHALSFQTAQLDRAFTYPSGPANQLNALIDAGYFDDNATLRQTLPLAPIDALDQSREHRVRSYLAANCAPCHQPGGGGLGFWDARGSLTTSETGLILGELINDLGNQESRLVVPGAPEKSMLLKRLLGDGVPRMPPLATHLIDDNAIQLVRDWITIDLPKRVDYTNWRSRYAADADSLTDPHADHDGDGQANQVEFLAGTNPLDPSDFWKATVDANGIRYTHHAFTGLRIETSTNTRDWIPEGPVIFPSELSEENIPLDSHSRQRFYRFQLIER